MNIALIGIGGYGEAYMGFFRNHLDQSLHLVAGVEPYPERTQSTLEFHEKGLPVFSSIEELYQYTTPDLVIIASPIPYHKSQAIYAMEHGSHVLCEKPLVPSLSDAMELQAVSERTGRKLGVGFQWSFSDTMLSLKKDLLNGVLGAPLFFKTHISWQRNLQYYTDSSWKGRIRNTQGDLVNDSIITNATAHYLHNIFFINGSSMTEAAMPLHLSAHLGRTYDIETFDTCFIKGLLPNGCEFLHIASHSAEENSEPKLEYRFENATVYFDNNQDPTLYAVFKDGTKKTYGQPLSEYEMSQKVTRMAEAIAQDTTPCCGVHTILPHLKTCLALFEQVPVIPYPITQRIIKGNLHCTQGLYQQTWDCYQSEIVPANSKSIIF